MISLERAVLGQQQSDVITLAVQKQIADGSLDLAGVRDFFGASNLSVLRQDLAVSGEAASHLNALYEAVLGLPIDNGTLAADQSVLASGGSLSSIRAYIAQN